MKIVIFENEKNLVEGAFNAANVCYYNSELDFKFYPRSQDFLEYDYIDNYDIIVIDINLSTKSELDGYGIIDKVRDINPETKIVILTGHLKVEDYLKARGLPEYPIIKKPITFIDIKENFDRALSV